MVVVFSLLVYLNPSYSLSDDFFYPPASIVNGLTYDEWAIKYWEWQVSYLTSFQQEKCVINNEHSVLFLANAIYAYNLTTWNAPGIIKYECTIPSDKPIYVHGMSEICKIGAAFPGTDEIIKNYDELLKCVKVRNYAASIDIKVDDRTITIPVDGKNYFTGEVTKKSEFSKTLEPFNITIPENSVFIDQGVGTDNALLDTKSVILKPLPVGDHVIVIKVVQLMPPQQKKDNLNLQLEYILHVK